MGLLDPKNLGNLGPVRVLIGHDTYSSMFCVFSLLLMSIRIPAINGVARCENSEPNSGFAFLTVF